MDTTTLYATPTELDHSAHNILIVDDTPVNLSVVVDYLQTYGFGIRIARSGESALQRIAYDPPDLIIGRVAAGHQRLRDLPPS